MSAEDDFWALKQDAITAGLTTSRMGQLAKLCQDYNRALKILRIALKTKNASAYVGKTISNLKDEQQPVIARSKEPEIVLQARLHGWPVKKSVRSNGEIGWWVAGTLYDKGGASVGG